MNSKRHLAVLVAALAISLIGAANASANFTSTSGGALNGTATATQVFTTNAGTVSCTGLTATGNIKEFPLTELETTIHYTGCSAFASNVHISTATYDFTTDGTVHLTNEVTITVTNIFGECTVRVTPQTLGTVTYTNTGTGGINLTPHVTGIAYHEDGGFPCENGTFTNGTYTGDSHVFVTGGTLSFDS